MRRNSAFVFLLSALAFAGFGAFSGPSQPRVDDGVYVLYSVDPKGNAIGWTTCGHPRSGGSGCFSQGILRRFEQACAIMEAGATTKENVVTRDIYVLDKRLTTTDPVQLYVFRRVDTYGKSVHTEVHLVHTLPLGLPGGPQSQCLMTANRVAIYAGTNATGKLAAISKSTFSIERLDFQVTDKLTYMTGGDRGYVAIGATNGFILITAEGKIDLFGGGPLYTLNHRNSVTLNVSPP